MPGAAGSKAMGSRHLQLVASVLLLCGGGALLAMGYVLGGLAAMAVGVITALGAFQRPER